MAYNKELMLRLENTINRYNAKIRRIKANDEFSLYSTPELVTYNDIVSRSVGVRGVSQQAIKKEIDNLNRYLKRGAEAPSGIEGISMYELEKLEREALLEQRRLTSRINRLERHPITTFGKAEDVSAKEINTDAYINLRRRREELKRLRSGNIDLRSFEALKEVVERQQMYNQRNLDWQSNYTDLLVELGTQAGIDPKKIKAVNNIIKQLTPEEFKKAYENDEGLKNILEKYKARKEIRSDVHALAQTDKQIDMALNDFLERQELFLNTYHRRRK